MLPDLEFTRAVELPDATAHELMSNRGGMVDEAPLTMDTDDEELRRYIYGAFAEQTYLMAPPGALFNYSNPNFSLVGLMTETLAGRPWADVVTEGVFQPLGMTRTVARKAEVDGNHCRGIGIAQRGQEEPRWVYLAETWENGFIRPAGLVWSTPTDQMRLARLLVEGDASVLSDEAREAMHQPISPLYPDLPGHYGYGLFVYDGLTLGDRHYPGVEVWQHGGNTMTHTSTFYVLPEQRFAISILSNGLGDDFNASVLAAIDSLVELPEAVPLPAPTFDAEIIDALVGTYTDPFNVGDIIVSRVGDALEMEMPRLDALEVPYERALRPVSSRVWVGSIQGASMAMRFVEGEAGEAYLANRAFVATRPAEEAPSPKRVKRAVTRAQLIEMLERGRLAPRELIEAPLR